MELENTMDALILVDIQNDFLPGGPLEVPEGDAVVPVANRLLQRFDLAVATRDWHPPDHGSFAANHLGKEPGDTVLLAGLAQHLWPVHCVQNTAGAEFPAQLDTERIDRIVDKGTEPDVDSYSGFFDNGHRRSTGLEDYLRERGVDTVHIAGLATNICVEATALDACQLGFQTFVVEDGCRGIDLEAGDVEKAKQRMRDAGAKLVESSSILDS